jgi:hypothetical protein
LLGFYRRGCFPNRVNAHATKFAPETLRSAASQIERDRKPMTMVLPRAGDKVKVKEDVN